MRACYEKLAAFLALCAVFSQPGCKRCSSATGPGPAASSKARDVRVDIPVMPAVTLPAVELLNSAEGSGLAGGCRVDFPIRSLAIDGRDVRFGSTRSDLSQLALLERREGAVVASSIFDFQTKKSTASPWTQADAPPPWDRATSGWVAGLTQAKEGSVLSAVLWRSGGPHRSSVDGDQLSVADVACDGDVCAMLSSLARESIAPGATLSWSDDHAATHIATEGEDAWSPLSIVRVSAREHSAVVALSAPGAVRLWTVRADGAAQSAKIAAPHGIYDVFQAEKPIVVAPALAPEVQCQDGGFPLHVRTPGGPTFSIIASGAPHGVFARPLGAGAIITWIAPAACRLTEKTTVGATLINAQGSPTGSPMVVGEAKGYALATSGDRLALWLTDGKRLVHLTARCDLSMK